MDTSPAMAFSAMRQEFLAGNYSTVLDVFHSIEHVFKGDGEQELSHSFRSLLNEKARALRNLGRLQEALDCNVEALRNAHQEGNDKDVAWQLVLLGKLCGKYLQRQSLFSACLLEGEHRLSEFIFQAPSSDSADVKFVAKRYAIVQDLLGSYHRRLAERNESAWGQCEASYNKAIEYHAIAANPDGISRATCHLAYARALRVSLQGSISEAERRTVLRDALRLFTHGFSIISRNPDAQRGKATRWVQQAHIYLMLRRPENALRLLREAIAAARESNDPRALLLAHRMLGLTCKDLGDLAEASRQLEIASQIASEKGFGFQREILANLAEIYFSLDEPHQAMEKIEQAEVLIKSEPTPSKINLEGTFEVFREIVPDRAENYLRRGQQQDYELLIEDLTRTNHLLKGLIARYERSKSIRLQVAIHQFALTSIRHAIKNELQDIFMTVREVCQRLNELEDGSQISSKSVLSTERSMLRIQETLDKGSPESHVGRVSLLSLLRNLAQEFFPEDKLDIRLEWDIVFRDIMPALLQEAFRHLLENIPTAIEKAPPNDSGVPYLALRHEWGDAGGGSFLLMNPGLNPIGTLWPSEEQAIVHGFQNASYFFKSVLGFECTFELRDDGPRTPPYRTNCVRIALPPHDGSFSWDLSKIPPR
jgi:tetratricopeptide (TPR) repeat protein